MRRVRFLSELANLEAKMGVGRSEEENWHKKREECRLKPNACSKDEGENEHR